MAFAPFTGREKIGRINLERDRESIRLRWQLGGKRYALAIGKESKEVLKAARAKAQEIDADITFDRFDPTLAKYGKKYSSTKLEVVADVFATTLTMRQLWDRFLEDKLSSNLKPKTKKGYRDLDRALSKIGDRLSFDALQVKKALLATVAEDTTGRCLLALSTCCTWGIKRNLYHSNPFDGMIADVNCGKRKPKNKAQAFTPEEVERIYEAFRSHQKGYYLPLVQFWFKTGCRPSEGVGLQWGHINDDCTKIMFRGSIQEINGQLLWSEGSKNNKVRDLNISPSLTEILKAIAPINRNPNVPVFPAPRSKSFINYSNFIADIWHLLVDPIKPNTTPYNCRDTFITEQILKGVPTAIIAKWCDTSIGVIEQKYADELRLSALRPID
jgi:integrase